MTYKLQLRNNAFSLVVWVEYIVADNNEATAKHVNALEMKANSLFVINLATFKQITDD